MISEHTQGENLLTEIHFLDTKGNTQRAWDHILEKLRNGWRVSLKRTTDKVEIKIGLRNMVTILKDKNNIFVTVQALYPGGGFTGSVIFVDKEAMEELHEAAFGITTEAIAA